MMAAVAKKELDSARRAAGPPCPAAAERDTRSVLGGGRVLLLLPLGCGKQGGINGHAIAAAALGRRQEALSRQGGRRSAGGSHVATRKRQVGGSGGRKKGGCVGVAAHRGRRPAEEQQGEGAGASEHGLVQGGCGLRGQEPPALRGWTTTSPATTP